MSDKSRKIFCNVWSFPNFKGQNPTQGSNRIFDMCNILFQNPSHSNLPIGTLTNTVKLL